MAFAWSITSDSPIGKVGVSCADLLEFRVETGSLQEEDRSDYREDGDEDGYRIPHIAEEGGHLETRAFGDAPHGEVGRVSDVGHCPHHHRSGGDGFQEICGREADPGHHSRGGQRAYRVDSHLALGYRGEDEIGGGVVEEGRKPPAGPEIVPGLAEADGSPVGLQEREGRDHGGEDAGKEHRYLDDGSPAELIGRPWSPWPQCERERGQNDKDHLADEGEVDGFARTAKGPGEQHRDGNQGKEQEIDVALQSHGDVVLHVHPPAGRGLLAVVVELDGQVHRKHQSNHKQPLGPQAQGPSEGHTAQEAQEERGVAQRCQEPAHVAHGEDEEDHRVLGMGALGISPQQGPYQHHGGAHRADEAGQHRANGKKGEVGLRGGDQVPGEVDAAGDGEEGEQEDDKRHVFLGGGARDLQTQVAEADY